MWFIRISIIRNALINLEFYKSPISRMNSQSRKRYLTVLSVGLGFVVLLLTRKGQVERTAEYYQMRFYVCTDCSGNGNDDCEAAQHVRLRSQREELIKLEIYRN